MSIFLLKSQRCTVSVLGNRYIYIDLKNIQYNSFKSKMCIFVCFWCTEQLFWLKSLPELGETCSWEDYPSSWVQISRRVAVVLRFSWLLAGNYKKGNLRLPQWGKRESILYCNVQEWKDLEAHIQKREMNTFKLISFNIKQRLSIFC